MARVHFPNESVRSYTITRILGAFGGQAIPYEAKDSAGHTVFLKQFHTPTPVTPGAIDFMKRQQALQDALGRIPAFVSVILDVFEHGSCFYQIAQWIEGTNLEQLYTEIGNDLNPDVTLLNAKVLAYSIRRIHSEGVAHLDLKPANIIMERKGIGSAVANVFRIIDFDGAIVEGAPPQKSFGTVPYQAPEQIEPDARGPLGKHTDIFALGIMLYQLLAGRFPFGDNWPQSALERSTVPPHEINAAIPRAVSELVWRALSPDSAERPKAAEIHQALLDAERKPDRLTLRIGSTPYRMDKEFLFGQASEEFKAVRGIETVSRRQLRFYRVGGAGPWEVALLSERVPMSINGEKIPANPASPPRHRLNKGDKIQVGSVEIVIDAL